MFYLVIFVIIILTVVKYLWNRREFYKFSSKCNGPSAWSTIVGMATVGLFGSYEDILKLMSKWYNSFDSPLVISGMLQPCYLPKTPEEMDIILNSPYCLDKMAVYEITTHYLGDTVVTVKADSWRRRRKALNPAFSYTRLNDYSLIFQKYSELLVSNFKKFLGAGEIDVRLEILPYSLSILHETAMGVQNNPEADPQSFIHMVEKARIHFVNILRNVFLRSKLLRQIFNYTPSGKQIWALKKEVDDYIAKVISIKEADMRKSTNNSETDDGTVLQKKCFLEMMLEYRAEGDRYTHEECQSEVLAFMIAGSETTAMSLSITLVLLATHPDFQERVYQEVYAVCGNNTITKNDIPHLQYMEMFLKESMRLYPPILFTGRCTTREVNLGKVTLPQGVSIVLAIQEYHRNPKIWPDPLKFDPDRFIPEEEAKRHPYAHIPFLGGPRNCIGKQYAKMSMMLTLASLVRAYRFKTSYETIESVDKYFKYLGSATPPRRFMVEVLKRN